MLGWCHKRPPRRRKRVRDGADPCNSRRHCPHRIFRSSRVDCTSPRRCQTDGNTWITARRPALTYLPPQYIASARADCYIVCAAPRQSVSAPPPTAYIRPPPHPSKELSSWQTAMRRCSKSSAATSWATRTARSYSRSAQSLCDHKLLY